MIEIRNGQRVLVLRTGTAWGEGTEIALTTEQVWDLDSGELIDEHELEVA